MLIPALVLMAALAGWPAPAQSPENGERVVLEYAGAPIRLPFACANEELAALGLVCSASSPCPIYLELTTAAEVEGTIFIGGNLHSSSRTLYSVLLASDDGGMTWTERHERIRWAGLDRIVFHNGSYGWALGHVLDGRPRNPFFLLTTDGGRFWRQRRITSEEGIGSVEKFWFDSERSGVVLLDRLYPSETGGRYERYETMTGAESWMIREVSADPIRVREPLTVVEAPAVKLRADSERGAWVVERQEGGGGLIAAEFLIEAGACAAEEPELAELPEQPAPPAGGQPLAPGGVFVIGSQPGPQAPPAAPRQPPRLKKDQDQ